MIISSTSRRNDAYENAILWIPAFAGMTEMDQTIIKAEEGIIFNKFLRELYCP